MLLSCLKIATVTLRFHVTTIDTLNSKLLQLLVTESDTCFQAYLWGFHSRKMYSQGGGGSRGGTTDINFVRWGVLAALCCLYTYVHMYILIWYRSNINSMARRFNDTGSYNWKLGQREKRCTNKEVCGFLGQSVRRKKRITVVPSYTFQRF